MFFPVPVVAPHVKEQWEKQAEFMVKKLNDLECHAIGLGESDFALGLNFLLKLKSQAHFPFLSANIVDSKTEKPLFDPYLITQVNGIKVGIFSVIDSEFRLQEGIKILDPRETSKKMVQELSSKVDVMIALTHEGLAKDVESAQKILGIDVIIGGHDKQRLEQPTQIKSSLILESGDQGKYVGVLNLFWKKGAHFNSEMEAYPLISGQLSQIEAKLEQLRKQPSQSKDNLAKDDLVTRQEQELLRQKWDLEQKLELIKAQGNTYYHELIALDEEISRDGDAHIFKEIQAFKKSLAEIQKKTQDSEPLPPKVTSQGNRVEVATYKKCMECHKAQYDVWKESKHASAIVPLYIRNQHLNPECIVCHSVGFREPGGFGDQTHPFELADGTKQSLEAFLEKTLGKKYKGSMMELRDHPKIDRKLRAQYVSAIEKASSSLLWKKNFIGVQCENCHSPRGVKDGLGKDLLHSVEKELPKKVVAQTCLQCHTSSQSPHFDFAKNRRILGEKNAQAPFHCKLGVAP